jgi:uncharacterized protein (TIGR02246 family)
METTTTMVEKILNNMESGWNNANGQEFSKDFAGETEYVDIRGTLHAKATPQQLAEAHQGLFMSIYKGSNVKYKHTQSFNIDDNIAFANADAELDAPSGPLAGKTGSTISMLLIKSDNAWKIRAFHNTLKLKQ